MYVSNEQIFGSRFTLVYYSGPSRCFLELTLNINQTLTFTMDYYVPIPILTANILAW